MEQERTVAKEYLKIRKSWKEAEPKAPSIFIGSEGDGDSVKAKVSDDGNLLIHVNGESFKIHASKVMELAQWMRETYVDFSVAAQ